MTNASVLNFLENWWGALVIALILLVIIFLMLKPLLKRVRPWFLVPPGSWSRQQQYDKGIKNLEAISKWGGKVADSLGFAGNVWIVNLWFGMVFLISLVLSPIIIIYWLVAVLPFHWFWYQLFNPGDKSNTFWKKNIRIYTPTYISARRKESRFGLIVFTGLAVVLVGVEILMVHFIVTSGCLLNAQQKIDLVKSHLASVPDEVISSYFSHTNQLPIQEEKPFPVANGSKVQVVFWEIKSILGEWRTSSLKANFLGWEQTKVIYIDSEIKKQQINIDLERKIATSRDVRAASPTASLVFNNLLPEWLHKSLVVRAELDVRYPNNNNKWVNAISKRDFKVFVVPPEEMGILQSQTGNFFYGSAVTIIQILLIPVLGLFTLFFMQVIKDFRYWRS